MKVSYKRIQQNILFETWKPVVGYEGFYEISSHGRLKSLRKSRLILLSKNSEGYYNVKLSNNNGYRNHKIHRLVAQAFLGTPAKGMVVNHKNGCKTDNKVDNLEYVSPRDNVAHSILHKNKRCAFIGVDFQKRVGKYRARILVNGVTKHIGLFYSQEEAGQAYQAALRNLNEHSKYALIPKDKIFILQQAA